MTRRFAALALIACAVLATVAGCSKTEEKPTARGALESIPADAGALASVELQRILADPLIAGALPEGALQEAEEESGLDLRGIRQVVLFVTTTGLSLQNANQLPGAFFIVGPHDPIKVKAALSKEKPLIPTIYKGQELLGAEGEETAIAFLESELFVLGQPKSVRAVIDIRAGDSPPLSGEVRDSFNALGSPLVKLFGKIPAEALAGALGAQPGGGLQGLPFDLSALTTISSVALTADKAQDQFALSLSLEYAEAAAAQQASSGLRGLVDLFKASAAGGELSTILNGLQINAQDKRVRIGIQLDAKAVEALSESFGDTEPSSK